MFLGAVAAVVLLASWMFVAWCVADRLAPGDRTVRGLVALVAIPWLLNAGFWALASGGWFRIGPALALALVSAAGAGWWRRERIGPVLAADAHRLLALARGAFSGRWLVVSVPVAALLLARVLRGSLLPPLAWDALTYRLFKAGSWVGSGGWSLEAAPDAWGYYRFFPSGGEILWAWALLPFSSDLGVAAAGGLLWSGLVLATFLASRGIGAGRSAALGTALAVGAMPVLLSFVTSSYVHALTTLAVLVGASLAIRFLRSGSPGPGVGGAAGFALAAAVHPGALPLVAVGGLALAVGVARHRSWRTAAGMVLATAVAWPAPAIAAAETGSPLYPLELRVGGVELFAGHDQLDRLHRGEPFAARERLGAGRRVALQLWDPGAPGQEMLSFGPGVVVLALLAAIGVGPWWREGSPGPVLAGVLFAAALLPALSAAAGAMHTGWGAPMLGRHLLPGAALLLVGGTLVSRRWATVARGGAALLGVAWGWPHGFGPVARDAVGELFALFAPVVFLASLVLLASWRLGRARRGVALAVGFVILAAAPLLERVRDGYREAAWAAAARAESYDLHPLSPVAVRAWPLWTLLADAAPRRIAYAAGWDGIGHNWYRYPFLGSRYQHEVVYVPVTADGSVLDYESMEAVVRAADFEAWLGRLLDRRIDLLATAPPDTLEGLWAEDHPAIFQPLARAGGGALFRLDREAAEALLDRI